MSVFCCFDNNDILIESVEFSDGEEVVDTVKQVFVNSIFNFMLIEIVYIFTLFNAG